MELRAVLEEMIDKYPEIWRDKTRFRELAEEYFRDNKLYKNLLVISVEETIPIGIGIHETIPNNLIDIFCDRITSACGCSCELAKEIVMAWIFVLGVPYHHSVGRNAELLISRSTLYKYIESDSVDTITVPKGINRIAKKAFSGSTVKEVILPEGVLEIGYEAFSECRMLERIMIPEGIQKIDTFAFSQCVSLRDMRLPDSLEDYGSWMFNHCDSLQEISMSTYMLQRLDMLGLPYPCRVKCNDKTDGDFIISENTLIRYLGLDSVVTVPKGINTIGSNAFTLSTATEIILPVGIDTIDYRAFVACHDLRKVSLPKSLKTIRDEAFWYCNKLSSINLPDDVEGVGKDAFALCSALEEITMKPKLIRECHKFGLVDTCVVKSSRPLEGDFLTYRTTLNKYLPKRLDPIVTVPNGIKRIGIQAFYGSNMSEVILPAGLRVIDKEAFSGCKDLKKVVLPESLQRIEFYAFAYCGSLIEIDIPDGVSYIDSYAFQACTALTRITVSAGLKKKLLKDPLMSPSCKEALKTRDE